MTLAVRAEALDQVVDSFHLEAFGQCNGRYVNGVKAECALAAHTIEMNVLVFE